MPYTADNLEINIASGTAIVATDYGTSGACGFSAAHVQISKLSWGDENTTYRLNEQNPLPIKIYGVTGTTLTISGTIAGTGDFYVRTYPTVPLIVKGSTFNSDAPVGISGTIQGVSGGVAVGVTGYVNILNSIPIYGISGATAIAVTGGRRLNFLNDTVSVYGSVGISGGFQLTAVDDSVSVYGPGGSTWIHANIYSGNTAIGLSGDALKVAVTNAGFTFSVTVAATVGVTNDAAGSALRIQGYTGGGYPVTIQGSLAGGAVEVSATTALPVGVTGTVTIDDDSIIDKIEELKTNIDSVSSNAGYALDILNLINTAGSGASVNVRSISKPARPVVGQKNVTTTPSSISSDTLSYGITVKSLGINTVDVYIGNSPALSTTNGFILSPGESVYLEVSSAGALYVRTPTGTATLTYIGS